MTPAWWFLVGVASAALYAAVAYRFYGVMLRTSAFFFEKLYGDGRGMERALADNRLELVFAVAWPWGLPGFLGSCWLNHEQVRWSPTDVPSAR